MRDKTVVTSLEPDLLYIAKEVEKAFKNNNNRKINLNNSVLEARLEQVANHIPLPNESNLYYLAKNYIQQKQDPYSLPEAKILVFCAPIKISELLLNKFLTGNLTEFSPRIHKNIGT